MTSRISDSSRLTSSLGTLLIFTLMIGCGDIDQSEEGVTIEAPLAFATQNPNAPVYDGNGTRCNVPAIPPPHPSCTGILTCPTPSTPPSQCTLEYVECPGYVCSASPPPDPGDTDPSAHEEHSTDDAELAGCNEGIEHGPGRFISLEGDAIRCAVLRNPPPILNPEQGEIGSHPEVDTQLPGGFGYVSYQARNRQWGQRQTIETLSLLGTYWWFEYTRGVIWEAFPALQIGDISFQGGGDHPGHKSHHNGLDVDIRVVRNDNKTGACGIALSCYSQPRTQHLINILESLFKDRIQLILSADQSLTGEHVRFDPGHRNHIHVRFKAK
jgi:hypothetical protein